MVRLMGYSPPEWEQDEEQEAPRTLTEWIEGSKERE
jgi:hypothetical protein